MSDNLVSAFPNEDTEPYPVWEYKMSGNEYYELKKCSKEPVVRFFALPHSLDDTPITHIGESVSNDAYLTSDLIIPETNCCDWSHAFALCTQLNGTSQYLSRMSHKPSGSV